jgi:isopentenyl-diphosphate delta-isomerase
MKEEIILVDSKDNEIGYEEKEKCHYGKTKLHRAFSIFLFNDKGEMLIIKRSKQKKTWPLHWSNAVCSHPRKGEETKAAAERRLQEELGISVPLTYLFKFEYKAQYDKEWGEHEMDWVFVGKHNSTIRPNKDEVDEWKFIDVKKLRDDIRKNPQKYTPWFKTALEKVIASIKN